MANDDKQQYMSPGNAETFAEQRRPRGTAASLVAEFVGTIIVTFATVAPAVIARGLGLNLGYPVEMATTGLATMVMIYSLRNVSGAHFNPCTTIAFALREDFGWTRVPGYVVMQFAGAIAAGAIVLGIFHAAARRAAAGDGAGRCGRRSGWRSCSRRSLVLVALSTANVARFIGPESAIANGATTVLARWIGGHVSSGSMNPARTLGPAIIAGGFGGWWIYVVAPLIGMAIAVGIITAMWREHASGEQPDGGDPSPA